MQFLIRKSFINGSFSSQPWWHRRGNCPALARARFPQCRRCGGTLRVVGIGIVPCGGCCGEFWWEKPCGKPGFDTTITQQWLTNIYHYRWKWISLLYDHTSNNIVGKNDWQLIISWLWYTKKIHFSWAKWSSNPWDELRDQAWPIWPANDNSTNWKWEFRGVRSQ